MTDPTRLTFEPADLPENHPYHLTQAEMDHLSALQSADFVFCVPDDALARRDLINVGTTDGIVPTRRRFVEITDSGRQCLALHEAMQ